MTEVGKLKAEIEELKAQLAAAAAAGGGGGAAGGMGGGAMSDEAREQMEAQLAERDAILKQSFEEKERVAREAEEMRMQMLQQQESIQAELARKAAEERRGMLENASDADQWVRMLLESSRAAGESSAAFVHEVEGLERQRVECAIKVREQASFITVLISHLTRELDSYLAEDARRQGSPGEASTEEQLASKLALEQLLLKMKNLREELTANSSMADELLGALDNMVYAAESQIERVREALAEDMAEAQVDLVRPSVDRSRQVEDLEMFVDLAGRQRDKVRQQQEEAIYPSGHAGSGSTVLEQLGQFGSSVTHSVEAELEQVSARLEAVEAGREALDDAAKSGMEKRVAVLKKELFVLGDVATKTELPRVLHGLSQVLQGVVLRLGKRLSMRDKQKERSMKEKEAQLERTRAEAEQLRVELHQENVVLKEDKQQLLAENERLRSELDDVHAALSKQTSANNVLKDQLAQMGATPAAGALGASEGSGGLAAGLVAAAADAATSAADRHLASSGAASGGATAAALPTAPPSGSGEGSAALAPAAAAGDAKANPFAMSLPALELKLDLGGINDVAAKKEVAATVGKLEIATLRLSDVESKLAAMTEQASSLAAAKRALEEGELATLRRKAAKLDEALRQHDPHSADKIRDEALAAQAAQSKQAAQRPAQGGGKGAVANLTLASLGIDLNRIAAAAAVKVVNKPSTSGVSVAKAPAKSLAESLVANAAANAVRLVGAAAHAPLPRKPPAARDAELGEKVTLAVPEGAVPGTQLTVTAPSGQEVTLTVPEGASAGQSLEVELPPPAAPVDEKVTLTVREGAVPGTQLTVTAPSGQQVTLTVPEGVEAGQQLEVELPPQSSSATQTVMLTLPEGYAPGQELTVTAPSGQQVTLTVPEGALPGSQLEVDVPSAAEADARREEAVRALASRSEQMALELAATQQATSSLQGQLASQQMDLESAQAAAAVSSAAAGHAAADGGAGPVSAPSSSAVSAAAAAEVAELEERLSKAAGELQAVRQERKETERLKMASEQMVLDLRQEKLRLEEAALSAEEQVLAAQEEADGKDAEVMEAKEAQMKAEVRAEQLTQRLASADERAHSLQAKLDGIEAKYKESHDEVVTLEEEKYRMVEDIEVLEEELEEANASTKRYYELLMERDAALAAAKDQIAAAKQQQQRLEY